MHIQFFRAMKRAGLKSNEAQQLVDDLEGHIAVKVENANKNLIAEIKTLRDDMNSNTNRLLSIIGVPLGVLSIAVAAIALMPLLMGE